MEALKERQSTREFDPRPFPAQILSDLLWAADGVNRPDSGKRTAPSAHDWRKIDIYVTITDGTYVCEPKGHALRRVVVRDLRALTSTQDFVAKAPTDLSRVCREPRPHGRREPRAKGSLRCRRHRLHRPKCLSVLRFDGLGNRGRGSIDRDALQTALGLGPQQHIILVHTVGYPG